MSPAYFQELQTLSLLWQSSANTFIKRHSYLTACMNLCERIEKLNLDLVVHFDDGDQLISGFVSHLATEERRLVTYLLTKKP